MATAAFAKPNPHVFTYVEWISRHRLALGALWLVLLAVAAAIGPQYLNAVQLKFEPPAGSPSAVGQALLQDNFPTLDAAAETVVIAYSPAGRSLLLPPAGLNTTESALRLVSDALNATLDKWAAENHAGALGVLPVTDYLTFHDQGLDAFADAYMGANNTASAFQVTTMRPKVQPSTFAKFITGALDDVAAAAGGPASARNVIMEATSLQLFEDDVLAGISHDFSSVDTVVMPLALAVLATVLWSPRLVLLTIAGVLSSSAITFLIMYPVAKYALVVINFAPDVTISAIIAISIDMSLFLLSRFREEIKRGAPSTEHAVAVVLTYAGHTVLTSGAALCLCFFALGIFPVSLMRSVGVSSGVGIAVTTFVNLSMLPLLLLSFSKFFRQFGAGCVNCCACCPRGMRRAVCGCDCCVDKDDEVRRGILRAGSSEKLTGGEAQPAAANVVAHEGGYGTAAAEDDGVVAGVAVDDGAASKLAKSKWYTLGTWLTKYPIVVVVGVLALAIPCSLHALGYKSLIGFSVITPRGSESRVAFERLQTNFTPGLMFPYFLVMQPNASAPAGTVLTEEFWDEAGSSLQQLQQEANLPKNNVISLLWFEGTPSPWWLVNGGLQSPCSLPIPQLCELVDVGRAEFINDNATVIYAKLLTPVGMGMWDDDGRAWLNSTRALLTNLTATSAKQGNGIRFSMAGGASIDVDTLKLVDDMFPGFIAVTGVVLLVVVAVAYRSVVVAVQAVGAVALTVSWVYGLASLTFEHGLLDFLGLSALANHGGISWTSPIMSFSIVVALGNDYQIFFMSRVVEMRRAGVAHKESIKRALALTGSIITAAGGIMAVAFGGLFFSGIASLEQLAFFLVAAVVLDTTVVRVLLLPALVALCGDATWWPRRDMPAVSDGAAPEAGRV